MICQKCKKREATRHESVFADDGTWNEVHLCEQCSDKGDLSLLTPASLVQAFIEGVQSLPAAKKEGEARSCPKCGITYAEFRSRGRLGCPHDYEVFQDDLLPLLEKIHHGGSQHVGKSPESTDGRSAVERELIELRRSLSEAVQREQYEEAARLRDRIHALEGGGSGDAGEEGESPAEDPPTGKAKRRPAGGRGGRGGGRKG